MLSALDDMQAIWILSFIEGHTKAGNEFNDFCVDFLYVQAAHHAYINVKARYDFASKRFLQQELGLVRVQELLFSFRISLEELLSELFPHWLVLGELEADLSIWMAWYKKAKPYPVNAIVHSASYLQYVTFLFATLMMFY